MQCSASLKSAIHDLKYLRSFGCQNSKVLDLSLCDACSMLHFCCTRYSCIRSTKIFFLALFGYLNGHIDFLPYDSNSKGIIKSNE